MMTINVNHEFVELKRQTGMYDNKILITGSILFFYFHFLPTSVCRQPIYIINMFFDIIKTLFLLFNLIFKKKSVEWTEIGYKEEKTVIKKKLYWKNRMNPIFDNRNFIACYPQIKSKYIKKNRNNQFDISILSLYILGSYYKQMVNTNSRLVTATVQK